MGGPQTCDANRTPPQCHAHVGGEYDTEVSITVDGDTREVALQRTRRIKLARPSRPSGAPAGQDGQSVMPLVVPVVVPLDELVSVVVPLDELVSVVVPLDEVVPVVVP